MGNEKTQFYGGVPVLVFNKSGVESVWDKWYKSLSFEERMIIDECFQERGYSPDRATELGTFYLTLFC